jgi:parvulin-like peptidyl-prolyl isomerase
MSESRPIQERPRADSPKPFRLDGSTEVRTPLALLWASALGLVMLTATAVGIYYKMPSADSVAKLDAQHTNALEKAVAKLSEQDADLQRQITDHTGRIAGVAGQVSFLVRLEVEQAKRSDDPITRRIVVEAARETRAEVRAAAPNTTTRNPDPLAGIDLED